MDYNEEDISNKSQTATLVLLLFLGGAGAHRFYVGKYVTGLLYGALGIGSWLLNLFNIGFALIAQIAFMFLFIIDLYALYSDSFTDAKGRLVIGKEKIMEYESFEERDQNIFVAKLNKLIAVLFIAAAYIALFIVRNFVLK